MMPIVMTIIWNLDTDDDGTFTLGDPENFDSANRYHNRQDTAHVETSTFGVTGHNLDNYNCIVRNTFHDGDCFHNPPEIPNDGISHIGANGYHFDNDNCSHSDNDTVSWQRTVILFLIYLSLIHTLLILIVLTIYRMLHFQDEAPF